MKRAILTLLTIVGLTAVGVFAGPRGGCGSPPHDRRGVEGLSWESGCGDPGCPLRSGLERQWSRRSGSSPGESQGDQVLGRQVRQGEDPGSLLRLTPARAPAPVWRCSLWGWGIRSLRAEGGWKAWTGAATLWRPNSAPCRGGLPGTGRDRSPGRSFPARFVSIARRSCEFAHDPRGACPRTAGPCPVLKM